MRRVNAYGLECAFGLRGAGTSQRIRGPNLPDVLEVTFSSYICDVNTPFKFIG